MNRILLAAGLESEDGAVAPAVPMVAPALCDQDLISTLNTVEDYIAVKEAYELAETVETPVDSPLKDALSEIGESITGVPFKDDGGSSEAVGAAIDAVTNSVPAELETGTAMDFAVADVEGAVEDFGASVRLFDALHRIGSGLESLTAFTPAERVYFQAVKHALGGKDFAVVGGNESIEDGLEGIGDFIKGIISKGIDLIDRLITFVKNFLKTCFMYVRNRKGQIDKIEDRLEANKDKLVKEFTVSAKRAAGVSTKQSTGGINTAEPIATVADMKAGLNSASGFVTAVSNTSSEAIRTVGDKILELDKYIGKSSDEDKESINKHAMQIAKDLAGMGSMGVHTENAQLTKLKSIRGLGRQAGVFNFEGLMSGGKDVLILDPLPGRGLLFFINDLKSYSGNAYEFGGFELTWHFVESVNTSSGSIKVTNASYDVLSSIVKETKALVNNVEGSIKKGIDSKLESLSKKLRSESRTKSSEGSAHWAENRNNLNNESRTKNHVFDAQYKLLMSLSKMVSECYVKPIRYIDSVLGDAIGILSAATAAE